jgi:TolB protein
MKINRLWLIVCIALYAQVGFAQGPIIVNIDNPSFRKLVAAVPDLQAPASATTETKKVGVDAAAELGRLLNFSGFFNIIAGAAYKDLMTQYATQPKKDIETRGMDGIDVVQWRALGVESLTIGEIEEEAGGKFTLTLRTADTNRSQLVLGKRYRGVDKQEINKVLRRYADLVLRAYTGKSGIFTSQIVFIGRKNKGETKQVFVADFDGSNVRQLTTDKSPHLSPSWSPDGRYVTYTSYEDGNPDLFMIDMRTGAKRKLSGDKGLNSGANWAYNGKVIAFTGSNSGDTDIFVISPEGRGRKVLIRGSGLDVDPTFSPDGKWILFVSGRFGNPHLFRGTLKWTSETDVQVTEDKRLTYAGWYNATPAWSPTSDKIAFAGYDKDIDRFDLFMMDPDGRNLERLTIRAGDNERPSWSPNGHLLVFQSNRTDGRDVKGPVQLFVMSRDGSAQRPLSVGLYEAQTPSWGPAEE